MKTIKLSFCIIFFAALCCFSSKTVTAASLPMPSYVNAFMYSSGSIRLSWDNSVSDASGFTIQKKTDSGGFITLANVSSSVSTYTDTRITNGHIYVYRVYATHGSLTGSAAESQPVEYLYPTGLRINSLSDSELELTWTYPYSGRIPETNYQTVIERRNEGSSTWQAVKTVPGNLNSYTDTELSEGSRYYYRIRALTDTSALYLYYPSSSSGQSAKTLLKPPSSVQAEILSDTSVKITWEDSSLKETGYRIERKTGNGSFVVLSSVTANTDSYIDKSTVNGHLYTYRVTAYSSSFAGQPGSEITVPFLFPVSFQIKEVYSNQMTLVWSYPDSSGITPDNSHVLIERREVGVSEWEHIHTTRPGETEYTDSGLQPGTQYYYRIRSRYDDGFITDYFPQASGISDHTLLSLDTHFYGYALSDTEILLEWDRDALGSHTVYIEKLSDSGIFEPLTTSTYTGLYLDRVSPGSLNTYRIKIRSLIYESDYSPEINITAETLFPVDQFMIKSVTPERVFMTWEYEPLLETGFEVWRCSESDGLWEHIGTTGKGQCMYSDETIENGETYFYRVRAMKNNTVFSPFSPPEPIAVHFPEPDGLLTVSMSDKYLYLGWDNFSDMERGYVVEYKTHINDIWHIQDTLPKDICLYRFIPETGIDYTLRIRAFHDQPVYESVSNECFYTTRIPSIPSLLSPSIVGSNRVALNWVDLSNNEDEFVIYRKEIDMENAFRPIGKTEGNNTFFSDDSVFPARQYAYIVKSKNAAGESFESNEIVVETPEKIQFEDLDDHPWARDAIEILTGMGIVNGDGKGNYHPAGAITRAEFIKLLAAAFSFSETPLGQFEDVKVDDWYHRWIMTAYRNGILEPDEHGYFYPQQLITRQDIVFYSARALKAAGYALEQAPLYTIYGFSDYREISPYAQSAFAAMNSAGIINGVGNNRLAPLESATRAEAAVILHRMIRILEKQGF